MSLKEQLIKNIPEFQRESPSMKAFVSAVGDYLDDAKEAIEQFDYTYDGTRGTVFNVEQTLKDRGLDIPAGVPEETRRRVLRDAASIFAKIGTFDSLRFALRLTGFKAKVLSGWMPAPRTFRTGFIRNIDTDVVSRYDVNRYLYTELLYGVEEVREDGVFFRGYRYDDYDGDTEYTDIPILGETYENIPDKNYTVAKTPYVIVRIEEGELNASIVSYTDPVTGETYEYSADEEFRVVNEIIRYFLATTFRPTTVRVIIIINIQPISDEIEIVDDLVDDTTYTPDGGDDLFDAAAVSEGDFEILSESIIDTTAIGSAKMTIGGVTPFHAPTEIVSTDPMKIGVLNLTGVDDEDVYEVQKPSGTQSIDVALDGATFYACSGDSFNITSPPGTVMEFRVQSYNLTTGAYEWTPWFDLQPNENLNGEFTVLTYLIEFRYVSLPSLPVRAVLNITTP